MPDITIISGGAQGADTLAEQFAKEFHLENKIFKADWNKYGKAAGPIRNEEMVKSSEFVIAFWDYKSKGTKSTIDFAEKHSVNCKIVNVK